MLIGAGGHFCPVAQRLGAQLGHGEPIIAAQETEFAPDAGAGARLSRRAGSAGDLLHPRPARATAGCSARATTSTSASAGRATRSSPTHVGAFLEWLAARGKIPADARRQAVRPSLPAVRRGAASALSASGALLDRRCRGPRLSEERRRHPPGDRIGVARGARPSPTPAAASRRGAPGAATRSASSSASVRGRRRRGRARPAARLDARAALAGQLFGQRWFARRVVLDDWFFHAAQAPLAAT